MNAEWRGNLRGVNDEAGAPGAWPCLSPAADDLGADDREYRTESRGSDRVLDEAGGPVGEEGVGTGRMRAGHAREGSASCPRQALNVVLPAPAEALDWSLPNGSRIIQEQAGETAGGARTCGGLGMEKTGTWRCASGALSPREEAEALRQVLRGEPDNLPVLTKLGQSLVKLKDPDLLDEAEVHAPCLRAGAGRVTPIARAAWPRAPGTAGAVQRVARVLQGVAQTNSRRCSIRCFLGEL